ncbi:MAG: TfoX/Sxy family protein [Spirochaetes bacterium]|nr:TfoX/Sxy family protein [Spirochaetota bacterium]
MAYDKALSLRIQQTLKDVKGISAKEMFGGLAFLHEGRMFTGVIGDDLIARIGPEAYPKALTRPHARPMDFSGKALTGYVYVAPPGCAGVASLTKWIMASLDFVKGLPAKKKKKKRPKPEWAVKAVGAKKSPPWRRSPGPRR